MSASQGIPSGKKLLSVICYIFRRGCFCCSFHSETLTTYVASWLKIMFYSISAYFSADIFARIKIIF